MREGIQSAEVKAGNKPTLRQGEGVEERPDTVSQLFEERDSNAKVQDNTLKPKPNVQGKIDPAGKGQTSKSKEREDGKPAFSKPALSEVEGAEGTASLSSRKRSEAEGNGEKEQEEQKFLPSPPQRPEGEWEALQKKLEKTEKILAENHKYGRSNAQRLSNALKAVEKYAEEGVLNEAEAKELLGVLQPTLKNETGEEGYDVDRSSSLSHSHPFSAIFQAANKELENIQKYTDDTHLPDKVKAFDYFLSIASREEAETILEELTGLMDDPLKLARRMLAIGGEAYDHSYKAVNEVGGFKNYLSQKEQEIEKLQKKLDKLEKKLLQYEDFDQPRYRLDELGDVDGAKPALNGVEGTAPDTLSTLFAERDTRWLGDK